jgi:UDP-hydrolysing UDP-N-acetyl-D-glucosamine 2-epimerase
VNRRRLLIVSSGRADVGGLAAIWSRAADDERIELHVALTGRHVRREADFEAAMAQLPAGVPVHVAGADLGGAGPEPAGEAMGRIVAALTEAIARIAPDMLLVLGDRLDIAPAALASVPFNLPLAHIHGGELTFGAVDDRLRHAVSKLAHLHFASSAEAAARLCRMGEEPWRIVVSGAPGLDTLAKQPQSARLEFLSELGLPADEPFALVTAHAETNAKSPLAAFEATLAAVDRLNMPVLATAANADMGGQAINERLQARAALDGRFRYFEALGARLYANALRHAELLVGNSSSGVIEAALFGLPVVDVGSRQKGRPRGANVSTVPSEADTIEDACRDLLGRRFDAAEVSLYGDGKAAERIVSALADAPPREKLLDKRFFDGDASFVAPWLKSVVGAPVSRGGSPESSGALVTRSRLVRDLRDLGVKQGAIVCAHVALSQLGFVVGGARTVIEALIEAVGDSGTLAMPAFSGDLSDPAAWRYPPVPAEWVETIRAETPPYDVELTPTRRMGAVPELFRRWPGTRRSPHPQSSFAARGAAAEAIVCEHPLDYRFGPRSPLAKLEALDATVALLGAPWGTISIFYRTQADAGPIEAVSRRAPVVEDGKCRWREYQDIEYSSHWFESAVEDLLAHGLARVGTVGQARALIFQARPALQRVREWRQSKGV